MVGEIFLVEVYFTDLKESKIRPVLIIKEIEQDVICLPLSTKLKENRIIIHNYDLAEGKLKKDSIVIVPKNITIHKSLLIRKIAKLKYNKFKIIFNKFCKELGCKEE